MTRVSASPLIDSKIEKRRHLPIKKRKEKRRHRSRTWFGHMAYGHRTRVQKATSSSFI